MSLQEIGFSLRRMGDLLSSAEGLDQGLNLNLSGAALNGEPRGAAGGARKEEPAPFDYTNSTSYFGKSGSGQQQPQARPLAARPVNNPKSGGPSPNPSSLQGRRGTNTSALNSGSAGGSSVFDRLSKSPTFTNKITPYKSLQQQMASSVAAQSASGQFSPAPVVAAGAGAGASSSSKLHNVREWDGPSATSIKLEQVLAAAVEKDGGGATSAGPSPALKKAGQNSNYYTPAVKSGAGIFDKLYDQAKRQQQQQQASASPAALKHSHSTTPQPVHVKQGSKSSGWRAPPKTAATPLPAPAASKPVVPQGSVWDRLQKNVTAGGTAAPSHLKTRPQPYNSVASVAAANRAHQAAARSKAPPSAAPVAKPVPTVASAQAESMVSRLLEYGEQRKMRLEQSRDRQVEIEKRQIQQKKDLILKKSFNARRMNQGRQQQQSNTIVGGTKNQGVHPDEEDAAEVEVAHVEDVSRAGVPPRQSHMPTLTKEAMALLEAEQRKDAQEKARQAHIHKKHQEAVDEQIRQAEEDEAERQRQREAEEEEEKRQRQQSSSLPPVLNDTDSYNIEDDQDEGVENYSLVVDQEDGTWHRQSRDRDEQIRHGDSSDIERKLQEKQQKQEEEEPTRKTAYELGLEMAHQMQAQYAKKKEEEEPKAEENTEGDAATSDSDSSVGGPPPPAFGSTSDDDSEQDAAPGEDRLGTGRPAESNARDELRRMDAEEEEEIYDLLEDDVQTADSENSEPPATAPEAAVEEKTHIPPRVPPLRLRALKVGW